jgi:hypothetical protein
MAKVKKEVVTEPATREELVALATEVNAVLNLDTPIKFGKKVSDEELAEAIVKECTNNVYEIDFIEDEADVTIPVYSEIQKEIFALLGIAIRPGSPADNQTPEDVPVEDEQPEEDAPEPVATKTKANKKADKKADAPAKVTPASKAPAKEKKEKGSKYTRYTACAEVVSSGKTLTIAEIAEKADALFVKNGGSSNFSEAKKNVHQENKTTVALGIAILDAKGFTYSA